MSCESEESSEEGPVMGDKTKIEWTEATWNPVTGCTKVSPGCDHCYIDRTPPFRMEGRKFVKVHRYLDDAPEFGDPTAVGATTGVRFHPERLDQPLRWKRPRRVFVNSLSDLFHDDVPDDYIARVYAVMAAARQHTFQVLTKRPARMRALLSSEAFKVQVAAAYLYGDDVPDDTTGPLAWPLPNVWLGVTTEDQKWADVRIPILLDTPAAVRFLSVEPMLGPVLLCRCDGAKYGVRPYPFIVSEACSLHGATRVDWVICGGESGPGARPMHSQWARDLRDQCNAVGVPFHFKQWGEWARTQRHGLGVLSDARECYGSTVTDPVFPGQFWREILRRTGKREAGRELDGRTWDEYPRRS